MAYIIVHILFNCYDFAECYPDPEEKCFLELWPFPRQKKLSEFSQYNCL